MRENHAKQEELTFEEIDHEHARELGRMSAILKENPELGEMVLADLRSGSTKRGAPGLSGEQVLCCAVMQKTHTFSYRKLAFHLADSLCMRRFCGFLFGKAPKKSALQENISRIREATWTKVRETLSRWAQKEGLEDALQVRCDSTGVESNILKPEDNQLLCDCVRVLARLMRELRRSGVCSFSFRNHSRMAKRRSTAVRNASGKANRREPYQDLIQAARKTRLYAERALEAAEGFQGDPAQQAVVLHLCDRLRHFDGLAARVIDQTERRVFGDETVPASEKVVSIFEEHTDILRKGKRDPVYGHKVFLAGGKTGLILDCQVPRGNPSDTDYAVPLLESQKRIYGRYPQECCFDGGFASQGNLTAAKDGMEIPQVVFSKKRGLRIEDMVSCPKIYKRLKKFRAGIEGCISNFKRSYGGGRCNWKGWPHFGQYVQCATLAFNLMVLARLRLD